MELDVGNITLSPERGGQDSEGSEETANEAKIAKSAQRDRTQG